MGQINGEIFLLNKLEPSGIPIKWCTESLSIGSDKSCDGYINSKSIDGKHCILTLLPDGHACITHTGSTNFRTLIEGIEITKPKILKNKSTFTVGDISFMFMYHKSSKWYDDPKSLLPKPDLQPIKTNQPFISTPKHKTYTIHCHKTNSPTVSPITFSKTKIKTVAPKSRLNVRPFITPLKNKLIDKSGRKNKLNLNLIKSAESRRHVSFGPNLSPEQFDKELPPIQPLKKGATPMKSRADMTMNNSTPKKNDESSDTFSYVSNDRSVRKRFSIVSSENSSDVSERNKPLEDTDFSLTRNIVESKDDSFTGKLLRKTCLTSEIDDSPMKRLNYSLRRSSSVKRKSYDFYEFSLENEKLNPDDGLSLNAKNILGGKKRKSSGKSRSRMSSLSIENFDLERKISISLDNSIDYESTHISSTPITGGVKKHRIIKSKLSAIERSREDGENTEIFISKKTRGRRSKNGRKSTMVEIGGDQQEMELLISTNPNEKTLNYSRKSGRRKKSISKNSITFDDDGEIDSKAMKNLFSRKSIGRKSIESRQSDIVEDVDQSMNKIIERTSLNISSDNEISEQVSQRKSISCNDDEIDNVAMENLFSKKSLVNRKSIKNDIGENNNKSIDFKQETVSSNISLSKNETSEKISQRKSVGRKKSIISNNDDRIDNVEMENHFSRRFVERKSIVSRKSKENFPEKSGGKSSADRKLKNVDIDEDIEQSMKEKIGEISSNISFSGQEIKEKKSPRKSNGRKKSTSRNSIKSDNDGEIDNEAMENLFSRKSTGRKSIASRKSEKVDNDENMEQSMEEKIGEISSNISLSENEAKEKISLRKSVGRKKSISLDNDDGIDNEAMENLFSRKSSVNRKSTNVDIDENVNKSIDVIYSNLSLPENEYQEKRKSIGQEKSIFEKSISFDNDDIEILFSGKSTGRRSEVSGNSTKMGEEIEQSMIVNYGSIMSNISDNEIKEKRVTMSPKKSINRKKTITSELIISNSDDSIQANSLEKILSKKSTSSRMSKKDDVDKTPEKNNQSKKVDSKERESDNLLNSTSPNVQWINGESMNETVEEIDKSLSSKHKMRKRKSIISVKAENELEGSMIDSRNGGGVCIEIDKRKIDFGRKSIKEESTMIVELSENVEVKESEFIEDKLNGPLLKSLGKQLSLARRTSNQMETESGIGDQSFSQSQFNTVTKDHTDKEKSISKSSEILQVDKKNRDSSITRAGKINVKVPNHISSTPISLDKRKSGIDKSKVSSKGSELKIDSCNSDCGNNLFSLESVSMANFDSFGTKIESEIDGDDIQKKGHLSEQRGSHNSIKENSIFIEDSCLQNFENGNVVNSGEMENSCENMSSDLPNKSSTGKSKSSMNVEIIDEDSNETLDKSIPLIKSIISNNKYKIVRRSTLGKKAKTNEIDDEREEINQLIKAKSKRILLKGSLSDNEIIKKSTVIISPIKSHLRRKSTNLEEINHEEMVSLFSRKSIERNSISRRTKIVENMNQSMKENYEINSTNISLMDNNIRKEISPRKSPELKQSKLRKLIFPENDVESDNEPIEDDCSGLFNGRRSMVSRNSPKAHSQGEELDESKVNSEKIKSNISDSETKNKSLAMSLRKSTNRKKTISSNSVISNNEAGIEREELESHPSIKMLRISEIDHDQSIKDKSKKIISKGSLSDNEIMSKKTILISNKTTKGRKKSISENLIYHHKIDQEAIVSVFSRKSIGRKSSIKRKSKNVDIDENIDQSMEVKVDDDIKKKGTRKSVTPKKSISSENEAIEAEDEKVVDRSMTMENENEETFNVSLSNHRKESMSSKKEHISGGSEEDIEHSLSRKYEERESIISDKIKQMEKLVNVDSDQQHYIGNKNYDQEMDEVDIIRRKSVNRKSGLCMSKSEFMENEIQEEKMNKPLIQETCDDVKGILENDNIISIGELLATPTIGSSFSIEGEPKEIIDFGKNDNNETSNDKEEKNDKKSLVLQSSVKKSINFVDTAKSEAVNDADIDDNISGEVLKQRGGRRKRQINNMNIDTTGANQEQKVRNKRKITKFPLSSVGDEEEPIQKRALRSNNKKETIPINKVIMEMVEENEVKLTEQVEENEVEKKPSFSRSKRNNNVKNKIKDVDDNCSLVSDRSDLISGTFIEGQMRVTRSKNRVVKPSTNQNPESAIEKNKLTTTKKTSKKPPRARKIEDPCISIPVIMEDKRNEGSLKSLDNVNDQDEGAQKQSAVASDMKNDVVTINKRGRLPKETKRLLIDGEDENQSFKEPLPPVHYKLTRNRKRIDAAASTVSDSLSTITNNDENVSLNEDVKSNQRITRQRGKRKIKDDSNNEESTNKREVEQKDVDVQSELGGVSETVSNILQPQRNTRQKGKRKIKDVDNDEDRESKKKKDTEIEIGISKPVDIVVEVVRPTRKQRKLVVELEDQENIEEMAVKERVRENGPTKKTRQQKLSSANKNFQSSDDQSQKKNSLDLDFDETNSDCVITETKKKETKRTTKKKALQENNNCVKENNEKQYEEISVPVKRSKRNLQNVEKQRPNQQQQSGNGAIEKNTYSLRTRSNRNKI